MKKWKASDLEELQKKLSIGDGELADIIGVTPWTIYLWKRQNKSISKPIQQILTAIDRAPEIVKYFK